MGKILLKQRFLVRISYEVDRTLFRQRQSCYYLRKGPFFEYMYAIYLKIKFAYTHTNSSNILSTLKHFAHYNVLYRNVYDTLPSSNNWFHVVEVPAQPALQVEINYPLLRGTRVWQ